MTRPALSGAERADRESVTAGTRPGCSRGGAGLLATRIEPPARPAVGVTGDSAVVAAAATVVDVGPGIRLASIHVGVAVGEPGLATEPARAGPACHSENVLHADRTRVAARATVGGVGRSLHLATVRERSVTVREPGLACPNAVAGLARRRPVLPRRARGAAAPAAREIAVRVRLAAIRGIAVAVGASALAEDPARPLPGARRDRDLAGGAGRGKPSGAGGTIAGIARPGRGDERASAVRAAHVALRERRRGDGLAIRAGGSRGPLHAGGPGRSGGALRSCGPGRSGRALRTSGPLRSGGPERHVERDLRAGPGAERLDPQPVHKR